MDLAENVKYLDAYINKIDQPLMISAFHGTGVEEIITRLEEFGER